MLKQKSYERMNAYQALNHPWITGTPHKTALVTGLSIKLSFKANQAMERLFSLLVLGKAMEQKGLLIDERKRKPTGELKEVSDSTSKEYSIKNFTSINRFPGKATENESNNVRVSFPRHVKDALDHIMKNKRFDKRVEKSRPRNFKISGLKASAQFCRF